MSDDTSPLGFGRFIPGFDFMQNLAKGASQAMPGLSGWIAPTMSLEELDKRIAELKAVQFWLEQNARALTATVQALEVQRMTLSTLQGMNVAMGDWAETLHKSTAQAATPTPEAQPAMAEPPATQAAAADNTEKTATAAASATLVDPVQWWGALTQQFQHIAAQAMQSAAPATAAPAAPAAEDAPPVKPKATATKVSAKKTPSRKRATE